MPNNPYPQQSDYTAIAIAYYNERLISDMVLPYVPVGKREFRYLKHKLEEGITIPDTRVGRTSRLNEVVFSATEESDFVEDFGLEHPVPQDDIDNAPMNFDPLAHGTEMVTNLVLLDREKRVADAVFSAGNYAAGQTVTLSGSSQFNDATSDPQGVIDTALDTPPLRPNIVVMGRAVWTWLRKHPKIVESVRMVGATAGKATRQEVAELFEIDEVIVGEGWLNTAKPGQAMNRVRVWGKHISLMYRDNLASASTGTSYGFTARFGDRVAMTELDSKIGLSGGVRLRVGEKVKEVIAAPDLGYLIINAVA